MSYDINTTLVLETIEQTDKKVYKARIADIKDDCLYFEMPFNEETKRIEAPEQGIKLRVWFQTPDKTKAYFDTSVLGRVQENIAMLIVEKPNSKSIYKKQRRDFVRVPAIIEAALEVITKEGPIKIICKTEDISGGGFSVKFNSSIKLQTGQKAKVWLVMPKKNKKIAHATGEAEIVRVRYPEDSRHLAWASFKFTKIMEGDRSKVIQFTFEKQIDLYGK
ncbi:flagellar brake protein [Desulfuribacillus alkaliarsenatis]|uniref:Pilus assembly protein PilZ n=1 Tax=Desulfuribacillus alkaliarsenatis TaxID=766136 RepID=A0A1E5G003_9FIRM|nr:flagellar brake domain-containing protein [Desulfuribacillus alkaliarsenatis]OEF96029.1 hypothetical protein BHF68_09795 [Desulfuribacillus alkaliarsenatis]